MTETVTRWVVRDTEGTYVADADHSDFYCRKLENARLYWSEADAGLRVKHQARNADAGWLAVPVTVTITENP